MAILLIDKSMAYDVDVVATRPTNSSQCGQELARHPRITKNNVVPLSDICAMADQIRVSAQFTAARRQ
jgi:hypothetical protein